MLDTPHQVRFLPGASIHTVVQILDAEDRLDVAAISDLDLGHHRLHHSLPFA